MKRSPIREALTVEFDRFVTPAILGHLYWLIRILITLQVSLFLAVLIGFRDWIGPTLLVLGFILTPVAWLFTCLVTRVILELFAVIFTIQRDLGDLARKSREEYHDPGKPPPLWS